MKKNTKKQLTREEKMNFESSSSSDKVLAQHGLNPDEFILTKVVSTKDGDESRSKIFVEPILIDGLTEKKIEKLYKRILNGTKLPSRKTNKKLDQTEEVLEISIIDFHLGKWDIDDMRKFRTTLDSQIDRYKYKIEEIIREFGHKKYKKIIYNFTSDFFHTDNIQKSTTAGTPQDLCVDPKILFEKGLDLQIFTIERLRHICKELKIMYYPSNHDELSTSHLFIGLSRLYEGENVKVNNVKFSKNLSVMDIEQVGNNFIGFIHDFKRSKRALDVFKKRITQEFGIKGNPYYEIHDGHLHDEEVKKYIDTKVRRFNSCDVTDKWHEDNLYTGNKSNFYIMKWHPDYLGPRDIYYR